ncbi:hypothetical protein PG984_014100 [Apiospora sp. TS-2023a]
MAFHSLPVELSQDIASRCSVPTVLALSNTCRAAYLACRDAALCRRAFLNQLRWVSVPGQDDTIPITEAEFKTMAKRAGADIVLWARYTAALGQVGAACVRSKPRQRHYPCKGGTYPEVDDETWRRDLAASVSYVPELLVVGSTSMISHSLDRANMGDDHFFDRHRPLPFKLVIALINSPGSIHTTCRRQTLSKLAFCFVLSCNQNAPFDYQLSIPEFQRVATRAQNRLTRDWNRNPERCLRNEHHHYFLLGFLFHTLSNGIIEVPRFEMALWAEPVSEQDASDLPLPFDDKSYRDEEDTAWDRWLRRTNARYCRREEIEGVEWLGQLTLGPYISSFDEFGYCPSQLAMQQARDAHLACFPELLRGLHFTIQQPQEAGKDEWDLISGKGTQEDREFTMEGQLRPAKSRVTLTMDSPTPTLGRLLLEGRVSPYGMVGVWCHEGQLGVQGFFWLFKEKYYFDWM